MDKSDYGFLARFLDVTKANLFFARGLLIVEGDAENILIPTLARLIGRDLSANGVSLVNVGGTGLSRFARIYLRNHPEQDGTIDVPVACIADFDVMPDCAPEIIGTVKPGQAWPEERRWRAKKDFTPEELQIRVAIKSGAKALGSDGFERSSRTNGRLNMTLAFAGLAEDMWIAVHLAAADERINAGKTGARSPALRAKQLNSYANLHDPRTVSDEPGVARLCTGCAWFRVLSSKASRPNILLLST